MQILHFVAVKLTQPLNRCIRRCGPALAFTPIDGTKNMLWTICLILLALWVLGIATSYTAGGLLHLLLLVALIVMPFRIVQGRRVI
jgi:hypothetical protein